MKNIPSKRFKKIIIATDNHGHYICKKTEAAFFKFVEEWQPDIRIHLGDNFDLSVLREGATQSDKMGNIMLDLESGMSFLERYSPDYWLWGNHDDRILRFLGDMSKRLKEEERPSKAVTSLEEVGAFMMLKEIKKLVASKGIKEIRWGVEQGVLKLGNQSFVHGYAAGMYATKKMAEVYGQVMHGHNHTGDVYQFANHSQSVAVCVPSLCDNGALDYQRGQISKTRHKSGWGLGVLDKLTGNFYHGLAVKMGENFFIQEPKVL